MVVKKDYRDLEQGDIIYMNLNSTKGHEQMGKRPCIILSKPNKFLNYMVGIAPITTKEKSFPLHVPLTADLKINGEILLEHHRMIDIASRGFSFVEKAPSEIINECVAKVKLLY